MFHSSRLKKNIKNEKFFNSTEINTETINGLYFPKTDGTNSQLLSTDGAGNLSFIDSITGDLINDLSPQLGGNLDLNNRDITGTGNISISGDITASNLNINGNTTHINTSTLTVEDPLIFLGKNNTGNTIDLGWYGKFDDGSIKYSGVIRDATDGKFKLFETSTEPSTTVSNIVLKDLELNNLDCNSITAGTWSGSNLTQSQITDLSTDLTTLTNNISSNDSDISSLNSSVSSMNSSISTNTSSISTNTNNISTNTSNISTNTSNISTNTNSISTNTNSISTNTNNISTNTNSISTNTSNISTNTNSISTNTSSISTNTSSISTNTSNIATNATNITNTTSKWTQGTSLIYNNTDNVGIGTTTPTSKLTVEGSLYLRTGSTDWSLQPLNANVFYITKLGTSGAEFSFKSAGNYDECQLKIGGSKIMLDADGSSWFNGGNVGIGTDNPAYKLELNGRIGFTSGDGDKINLTFVQDGAKISHSSGWYVDMYAGRESISTPTGRFRWFTGNSSSWVERMRIENNGFLGIGTDNPSEKLHIYSGNIRTEDLYTTDFNIEGNVIATHHNADLILDTAEDLIIKTDGTERFRIDNDGEITGTGRLDMGQGSLICMEIIDHASGLDCSSTSWTDIISGSYTKKVASSLLFCSINNEYNIGGSGNDVFEARLRSYNGTTYDYGRTVRQRWGNAKGGGTRGSTLNTAILTTSIYVIKNQVIDFTLQIRRASGGDTYNCYNGIFIIHEISN